MYFSASNLHVSFRRQNKIFLRDMFSVYSIIINCFSFQWLFVAFSLFKRKKSSNVYGVRNKCPFEHNFFFVIVDSIRCRGTSKMENKECEIDAWSDKEVWCRWAKVEEWEYCHVERCREHDIFHILHEFWRLFE